MGKIGGRILNFMKTFVYKQLREAEKYCPKTVAFHKNFPKRKLENNFFELDEILEKNVDDKYWYAHNSKYVKMLNELYEKMFREKKGSEKTFYQIRRVYPRANKQKLCPTLTANMGTGGKCSIITF